MVLRALCVHDAWEREQQQRGSSSSLFPSNLLHVWEEAWCGHRPRTLAWATQLIRRVSGPQVARGQARRHQGPCRGNGGERDPRRCRRGPFDVSESWVLLLACECWVLLLACAARVKCSRRALSAFPPPWRVLSPYLHSSPPSLCRIQNSKWDSIWDSKVRFDAGSCLQGWKRRFSTLSTR